MEKQPPPVRIIVPGKVYRRDNPDSTHGYMFHQIEGLAVDTDITFCDFKGTVEYFVREFLGPKVKTRLRPSYFPFTEPSAEVDATCHVCGGSGCRVCKFSGWIEFFGAGMVNPAVYGFVKYDAQKLSGFAFGMGVDRLAMMKYGITELPMLFQNDVRFLQGSSLSDGWHDDDDPKERFSNRVEDYIRYRPGLSARGNLDVLRKECGLTAGIGRRGCRLGNGLAGAGVSGSGNLVYGVEPNTAMREAGERLLEKYRNFYSVVGSAEATTLAGLELDVVAAGRRFIGSSRARRAREFLRILRPDGWVAVIWK